MRSHDEGQALTTEILQTTLMNSNRKDLTALLAAKFQAAVSYRSLYSEENYLNLCTELDSDEKPDIRMFYLAIPPNNYDQVAAWISAYCKKKIGTHLKVAFEKPFGDGLSGSKKLVDLAEELFNKEEVFFVDHYLGKPIVRDLIHFRKVSGIEKVLHRRFVERIEIVTLEKENVKGRHSYYGNHGASIDMFPNHLTELMLHICTDLPGDGTDQSWEELKHDTLASMQLQSGGILGGQYKEYCDESQLELNKTCDNKPTFSLVTVTLKNDRWNDVPVVMATGKKLHVEESYIRVIFKQHILGLGLQAGYSHKEILFILKQTEFNLETDYIELSLTLRAQVDLYFPGNYEEIPGRPGYVKHQLKPPKLPYLYILEDMYGGQQTYFVSPNNLMATWEFWDDVITMSEANQPFLYDKYFMNKFSLLDSQLSSISKNKQTGCSHQVKLLSKVLPNASESWYGDLDYLLCKLCHLTEKIINEAIARKGVAHIAIPGGTSPIEFYKRLQLVPINWSRVHIWQTDERCMPITSDLSNAKILCEHLIDHINIPWRNVHLVSTFITKDYECPEWLPNIYSSTFLNLVGRNGRLDLVLLGVGSDGHVASLFPGLVDYTAEEPFSVTMAPTSLTVCDSRVSISLSNINKSNNVILLITTSKKKQIMKRIFTNGCTDCPLMQIKTVNGSIRYFIDENSIPLGILHDEL